MGNLARRLHANWLAEREEVRSALVLALTISATTLVLWANPDAAEALEDEKYKTVCQNALTYLEGDFGALLTAMAGIGAIVASALGGFKVAWTLIVVAVGSFILREFITGGTVGMFTGKC